MLSLGESQESANVIWSGAGRIILKRHRQPGTKLRGFFGRKKRRGGPGNPITPTFHHGSLTGTIIIRLLKGQTRSWGADFPGCASKRNYSACHLISPQSRQRTWHPRAYGPRAYNTRPCFQLFNLSRESPREYKIIRINLANYKISPLFFLPCPGGFGLASSEAS